MKNNRSFFLAIVAFLTMTTLSSCAKDTPTCPSGYLWSSSIQNQDGTVGACVWTGANSGSGPTTNGQGTGLNNTTYNATYNQAYPDFNHDWFADLANPNTLAGGTVDMRWRYVDFTLDGVTIQHAIIQQSMADGINVSLFGTYTTCAIKAFLTNGTLVMGSVVFTVSADPNGLEMGNTYAEPYDRDVYDQNGYFVRHITKGQLTGNAILYQVTGYRIQ